MPSPRRPRPALLVLGAAGALLVGLLGPTGAAAAEPGVARGVAPTTLHLAVHRGELIASVESADGTSTPTGEVVFTVDGDEVGTADLLADPHPGVAHATLATTVPRTGGPRDLRATYAGDATTDGSTARYVRTDPTMAVVLTSSTRPNAAGWYRTPVTATFTCTDGSAHLEDDTCPAPLTRRRARTGPSYELVAVDGGSVAMSLTAMRVDPDAPRLTVRRAGSAPYAPGARPVRCRATDGRSGVAGGCTVSYGGLHRGPRGGARRVWTARATDVAGNTRVRRGSVGVRR